MNTKRTYTKRGTSLEKGVERIIAKAVDGPNGCWLFKGMIEADGYGRTTWNSRQVRPHRLVYEFHHGPIPAGHFVRHRCDVRNCVNPDHLETGLPRENTQDMMERGRHRAGGGNPGHGRNWSILSLEDVNEMRKLSRDGMSQLAIGKRYGVSQSVAGDAICEHTFKDATEPPVPRRQWGPGKPLAEERLSK
jgi:hypothetical protein